MVLHPEASNTNTLVRVIIEYLSVRIPFVKGPTVSLIKSVEIFLLSSEKHFGAFNGHSQAKAIAIQVG